MRLSAIQPGDLVLCDVRGVRFHAEVTAKQPRGLTVSPITANITYREVKSSQVVRHWRAPRTRAGGES